MDAERPTVAVQDYLKAIYHVEEDTGRLWVTTSEVARSLGVSAPSASAMLKRLGPLGYVVGAKRRGSFALTDDGRAAALEVIRHHRLLETFLVTRLGVPIADVHREAEVLEHHISEALEARIAEELGHPERDPHGAPIPSVEGEVDVVPTTLLTDVATGASAVVSRVGDRDPSLLRGLEQCGIVPDAGVQVLDRDADGTLRLSVTGGEPVWVPQAAARVVRVMREAETAPSLR